VQGAEVMGLLFKKNKTYVDKIINKLTECGYKVSSQKLFSEDFGVPQKRHRALITTFGFNISTPLIASKNKSSSTCSACPSLNFKKNKNYVDKIINKLTECGYKVSSQKLFSEDFGVPQKSHNILKNNNLWL
jgi:site-specific DNA-cytosine methylase